MQLCEVQLKKSVKDQPSHPPLQNPSVINQLLHAKTVSYQVKNTLSLPLFQQKKNHHSSLFQKIKNHYSTSKASKNPTNQLLHANFISFTPNFCRTRQVIRTRNSSAKTILTSHPLHANFVRSTKLTKRLSHMETVRC